MTQDEKLPTPYQKLESGIVLSNMAEMIITTRPERSSDAIFYLKLAMQFYEQKNPTELEKLYGIFGLYWMNSGDVRRH